MNPLEQLRLQIDSLDLWEHELEFSRNQYVKVRGSIDTNLYYVTEGSLRFYVIDQEEEHTIRFAYQGNFVAAIDSFLSERPSDLYIQALKKTSLKCIGKKAFMAFLRDRPDRLDLWQSILGGLIYQLMERERDLLTSSPSERYHRVLQRSPRLFQEIPHRHIASYLRMTPETLSRIKKS